MNQVYYGDPYGYGSAAGAAAGILGGFAIFGLLMMAMSIVMLVSMWKVFTKCGKPGWASIVPLYNMYVLTEIAGVAWWYILLFCVPIANLYAMFVIYNNIAQKFGKSTGFTIGMMIVPFVFWPMLAFSKDASAVETLDMQPMDNSNLGMAANAPIETLDTSAPIMGAPVGQPTMSAPVESAPMVNDFNANAFTNPVVNEPVNQMPVQEPVMSAPVDAAPMVNDFSANAFTNPVVNEPVMQAPVEPAPMVNDFDANTFANPVVNEPVNQMPVQEPVMQAPVEPAPMVDDFNANTFANPVVNEPVNPQPVQNTYVSSDPINNNQMNNNNNIQF